MTTVEMPAATTDTEPWVPSDSTFGARLALVRQKMGWGNVKVAAVECGLPVETWRTWERDNVEPKRLLVIAMAIASRTGCDYLWLVHGPNRGGAIRSTAYVGARAITTVSDPHVAPSPDLAHPARAVRQTRPIGGVSLRPFTPTAR